ncbi:MAG: hypothetical protein HOG49_31505 [Candidatus Scalindua sp.]|jgi:hypothetical protein|nr:hypothetical protein [Candidatus Scalindua sp.]
MDSGKYLGIIVGIVLLALSACFIAGGCDPNSGTENNGSQTIEAIDQHGQTVRIVMQTPSREEHIGTSTHVQRKVSMVRIMSPFGVSAGEVIAKQEPMTLHKNKKGELDVSTGGFRWTLFDSIWMWIKNIFWFGILGGAILLILFFVFPAARPIIGMIGRTIGSIIPIFGSIIERISAGLKWKKPLEQVVVANQNFKTAINANENLTPDQKKVVIDLFKTEMMKEQDKDAQTTVKTIKLEKNK